MNIILRVVASCFVTMSLVGCLSTPKEKIVLHTLQGDGGSILIAMDADSNERDKVWIDLNDNGVKDEGESVTRFCDTIPEDGRSTEDVYVEYAVQSAEVVIHGKLTMLSCVSSSLDELDVSHAPSLRTLICKYNQLESLDLSANTALEYLDCGSNRFKYIDLNTNRKLHTLRINDCKLEALDVSEMPDLEELVCAGNFLTQLDVSKNKSLRSLYCYHSSLTELDLSENKELTKLICGNTHITTLDLSHNNALVYLKCLRAPLHAIKIGPASALKYVFIPRNNMDKDALETLFATLPRHGGVLCVDLNPGATDANVSIAHENGWADISAEELALSDFDGIEF
ncbi:leucine-rich repeat domain-containing protein [Porphyromonas sp.]|uniref:leucine-rich repeat domain-containing protein n=1 Tax=Porphyromonas sp. TaxID=1924944 RepID=UPI0026DD3E4E|nr:hypothetical protein [Porphyromonas sp.]MDO4771643.1 hypothetical protein [Porphyromonas sp.]